MSSRTAPALARLAAPSPAATVARVTAIVVGTALVSALLRLVDADLATAALALLAMVVFFAAFGAWYGLVAVVCAYVALNWAFTTPIDSLAVDKIEDFVPLLAYALAAAACSLPSMRHDARPVAAVAAVGLASAILVAADADLVVAALVLLGVVVVTAVMGVPSAVTAVVASYLALNYWFTPPIGSLEITKAEDLAPLIAFATAAAASAATVARIEWLRRRAAIVEQREFEARVSQATSDSRAAFLTAMTHNLRTPLATIKASLSALLASPAAPVDRQRQLLTNARAETDRLERLVTKVLELARIHAGAIEPSPETVDLGEVVGAAARRLDHLASERDVHVVVRSPDLVLASVDPDMLDLVFIVMLENALRFAPPHSQIDVIVESMPPDQSVVRVVDHGPGIPSGEHEAVFDEFVRLDRDGGGAGLGLTIARSLVDAHGGRMWVEDTPGGGATVVASVPAEVLPS
jgi:two-component system sensor histidine kinase KdpD